MDAAIALGVAALVAAFVVPAAIEWLKRPHLEISPSPWSPAGPVAWTFAAVRILNKPVARPFRWLLTREVAQGCTVALDVFKWGTDERAVDQVQGRWSSHPEPIRLVPSPAVQAPVPGPGTASLPAHGQPFTPEFDPGLIQREQDVAVTAGGEEVAVAILRAGEAFVFTDDSYGHPAWGRPDLKLDRGTYCVVVRVRGSSVERERAFKLEYLSDDFAKFRLELV
jgi:hypothetical protein